MRKALLFIPLLSVAGAAVIAGSAFSAWYFGEAETVGVASIETTTTDGGKYGRYLTFDAPDKIIFEAGSTDAYDLSNGMTFYRLSDEIDSITGTQEGSADDIVSATFLRYDAVPSEYDYDEQVELGVYITITGTLASYVTIKDEYKDGDSYFVPFESSTAKGDLSSSGSSVLEDGQSGTLYSMHFHCNNVFRFLSTATKPTHSEAYASLRGAVSALQGEHFITMSASIRPREAV